MTISVDSLSKRLKRLEEKTAYKKDFIPHAERCHVLSHTDEKLAAQEKENIIKSVLEKYPNGDPEELLFIHFVCPKPQMPERRI
jgi:DNA-binding MarR family transcriptional regulator